MKNLLVLLLLFCLACITTSPVFAEDETDQELIEAAMDPDDDDSDGELARAAQNPLAAMISLPFQNNTNFNFGPMEKTQNVMNIQPVVPFRLKDNWNLITRTILPIVSQPAFVPGQSRTNALGDTVFTAFLSPSKASSFVWGAGVAVLIPTGTSDRTGFKKWGIGPSLVGVGFKGPWVYGGIISNVWDFAGSSKTGDINLMSFQYFVNYNLPSGWYLVTSPIITANWEADSGNKWTIPFGGGAGKIVRFGKVPVNLSAQAYYNVEKPAFGADWQLRLVANLMFPKQMPQIVS